MADPDVDVVIHQDEVRGLIRTRFSPVLPELHRQAQPMAARARRRAPVSKHGNHGRPPGWLRANILIRAGEDTHGVYVDVATTARSPSGFPYGRVQERRRPYLRPSITR